MCNNSLSPQTHVYKYVKSAYFNTHISAVATAKVADKQLLWLRMRKAQNLF